MVTMSDIARRTGVSVATVSNALTDRGRLSATTRARIKAVASELGYEVNLRARHLRVGRTDTIALIAPSFHGYFSEIADQLALLVEAGGRHLVLERTAARTESELEAVTLSRLQMFDGVLLSAVGLDHRDIERARSRVPLVLLGERVMPATVDHVSLANEDGARVATAHMLSHGARRVVVLGGSDEESRGIASSRRAGWQRAHDDAGVPADPDLILPVGVYSPHDARVALERAMASGLVFDAVFAVTDMIALGALSALAEAGRSIPGDVQVAGFDNLTISDYTTPRLTSVDPNHEMLARSAMDLLERRMTGSEAPAEHVVTPVSLVTRATTR